MNNTKNNEPTLWQLTKDFGYGLGLRVLCLFAYPGLQILGDWLL